MLFPGMAGCPFSPRSPPNLPTTSCRARSQSSSDSTSTPSRSKTTARIMISPRSHVGRDRPRVGSTEDGLEEVVVSVDERLVDGRVARAVGCRMPEQALVFGITFDTGRDQHVEEPSRFIRPPRILRCIGCGHRQIEQTIRSNGAGSRITGFITAGRREVPWRCLTWLEMLHEEVSQPVCNLAKFLATTHSGNRRKPIDRPRLAPCPERLVVQPLVGCVPQGLTRRRVEIDDVPGRSI